MRGSFAKARVLYAPVEEIGDVRRLLRACHIHFIVSSQTYPAEKNYSICFFFVQVLKRTKKISLLNFLSFFISHH